MWLVSTLLIDHWFANLSDAYAFYEASQSTRTYPRLESDWPARAGPFQEVVR